MIGNINNNSCCSSIVAVFVESEVEIPTYEVVIVVVGMGSITSMVLVLSTVGSNGNVVIAVVESVTVLVVTTTAAPLDPASLFVYDVQKYIRGSFPFAIHTIVYIRVIQIKSIRCCC